MPGGFPRLRERYDLVVVGGGHAGLQAGLKAALLRKTTAVLDRGPKYSRSYYAPSMANIPGFPAGISGHKLLDLQIEAVRAASEWTDYITPARVVQVSREDGRFAVELDWLGQRRRTESRFLVLALGVVDRIVEVDGKIEPIFPWANQGIVDFCVLCDGHDLPGKSVGVIGWDAFAARSALELSTFAPASLELLTHGQPPLEGVGSEEKADLERELAAKGVGWNRSVIAGFDGIREHRFGVRFADGTARSYDRGFSALGWYDMHGNLPSALGCRFDADGYVLTDDDSRALSAADGAPIPGLYVVGDLRSGWNQIPEAWATAERAVIHAWAEDV